MPVEKVLHFNSYFFTNKLHENLVEGISTLHVEQEVYIPYRVGDKVPKKNDVSHIRYTIRPAFRKIHVFLWPLKVWAIWNDVKRVVSISDYDIIHAHSLFANGTLALLSNRFFGKEYIVTIRNTDVNKFLPKSVFFRWLGVRILNKAKYIVTLSPQYFDNQLKRQLGEKNYCRYKKKHKVIPNAIDDFWLQHPAQPKEIEGRVTILFIGLISKNKNLDSVIATCERLSSNGIDIELQVVGDGPRLGEFKAMDLGFDCIFHGYITDKQELKNIYNAAHILFVPSFTESFGLVYLEAMSQGLPVVYSLGQGFDGLITELKVGVAVDPYNIDSMINGIEEILENYSELSKNALSSFWPYDWNIIKYDLLSMYEE